MLTYMNKGVMLSILGGDECISWTELDGNEIMRPGADAGFYVFVWNVET